MLDRRVILVAGKGGVGRSAVTAALAIRAARAGRKVLCVAMTDPSGLAAHLGVESLSYRATSVKPGISALMIDRSKALDEYLHLQLHAPRVAPLSPLARGLSVLAETVPGVRDVITMGKVLFEARTGQWDLVIADTPPLGQLISYLRAPAVISELVPAGRVREQAAWMEDDLADPRTSNLLMVTLAEELPVSETNLGLAEIEREGLVTVGAVAVNRMLGPLGVGAATLAGLPSGPHRDAGLLHRSLHDDQRKWLAELPPHRELPFLFGVFTPPEIAARLADELEWL